jgi:phospholipid/cholesterol/gamma-HCH transport system substrate-binding protein
MNRPHVHPGIRRTVGSSLGLGIILIVLVLVAGYVLFNKNKILTDLKSGETIKIHFASGSELVPYLSRAKVAFVAVGVVTGDARQSDGTSVVSVKVDDGTRAKLGSEPSAVIRPTTLLGGNYFVDLVPGGDRVPFSGAIPISRTHLPVELDKIANALQPDAVKGLQATTRNLDATLKGGGASALDQLAADAPAALNPGTTVLHAALGTNPYTDLTGVVAGLETTAKVVTTKQGQLDDIVNNMTKTTAVLSNRAQDLAATIAGLPATLQSANTGLQQLDVTLKKLRDTSDSARPVVTNLGTLLAHASPVLIAADPVIAQANKVLTDAQPLVQQLVPTAKGVTSVLNAVRGPVLSRVNGPVKTFFLDPYHGAGPYAGTGSTLPVYKELAYMFADLDRAAEVTDKNGATIGFEPGVGPGTIGGLPISLEQMFTLLTNKLGLTPGQGGK